MTHDVVLLHPEMKIDRDELLESLIPTTVGQFFKMITTYTPTRMHFMQIIWVGTQPKPGIADKYFSGRWFSLHLFYFDHQYKDGLAVSTEEGGFPIVFKFGCQHDYETIVSRMCYSESKCKKCGHQLTIDSSG